MKRDFNSWLSTFRECISNYAYYTDFSKVYANVDEMKVELNILNSLIGSKNIEDDFEKIVRTYPETLKCIPVLLAVRSDEIKVADGREIKTFSFSEISGSIEDYKTFMRETGLFDLLKNHVVHSLIDYVTGVETGLDSNGRKNRGGHLMENLVESFIQKEGFEKGRNYFKEMYTSEVERSFGVDLSKVTNKGKTEKRWDFVVKADNFVYLFETNFYASSGSKLQETARSYLMLATEMKDNPKVKFIWITDGNGWRKTRKNLEETFATLDNLYNINDLENGVLKSVLK